MRSTRLSKSAAKGAENSLAKNMPSSVNKKLLCEICGKSFQHEGVLGRHRSLHTKTKVPVKPLVKSEIYSCNACLKVFNTKATLGRHRCTKSKLNNIESFSKSRDVSRSTKFLNKRQLDKKVIADKSIPVQISSAFKSEGALSVGAEIVTDSEIVVSRSSSRIESKKSLSESVNKSLAENIKSSALQIKGASKSQAKKSKPEFKNPVTESTISKANKVERHTCKVCNKHFNCESKLQKHETLHDSSKPFSCDVCGKFFDDIRFVKTHKTLHEKKSRKECDVCGKVFNERIFFEIHCLTHVEQKPFRCDICEDIFKDKSTFMRHCKGHKARTKKVAERFLSMKEVLKQKLEDSNRPS